MNVDNFRVAFNDLARPNRFRIQLSRIPQMEIFAKATEVPNNAVDPMDVNYMGRIVKLPGDRQTPDWNITVYGSNTWTQYNAFEQWLAEINQPEANTSAPPAAVWSDGIIQQLDRQGGVAKTWQTRGCFPIDLGAISLDWGNNSTPLEFTVALALQYVQPVG